LVFSLRIRNSWRGCHGI